VAGTPLKGALADEAPAAADVWYTPGWYAPPEEKKKNGGKEKKIYVSRMSDKKCVSGRRAIYTGLVRAFWGKKEKRDFFF